MSEEKNKGGRPSKFSEGDLKLIKYMCKKGATDKQIAEELDVCVATIANWKVSSPEFLDSLKDWKKEADAEITRSLFERAKGYSCKETKVFCHEGMIVSEDIVKHYPPDPTSMIFWLKNRQPQEWRDKTEVVSTNTNMSLEEFLKQQSENKEK